MHVAGADAQLQHHRRLTGFGQFETGFDRRHDGRQIGARIEHPDLGLHGERMAALLHDRRTLAVILTHDDQGAARDATGGQIGQSV